MYSSEMFAACDWIYRDWMREALNRADLIHLCPGVDELEEIRTIEDLTHANELLRECRFVVAEELQRMWVKGWEQTRLQAYDLTFAHERTGGLMERRALIISDIGTYAWLEFVKPARDTAWDAWMYYHLWSLTNTEYHGHQPEKAKVTHLEGLRLSVDL